MLLIKAFDIFSDFWSMSPELKVLFRKDRALTSKEMWACLLYAHPESKFYNLDPSTREKIISEDYLLKPFSYEKYKDTITRIQEYTLTSIQRVLSSWDSFLQEREQFMAETKYSSSTYEMLDKMRKDTYQMAKQYKEIYKEFMAEQTTSTHGDVEESLSEKFII